LSRTDCNVFAAEGSAPEIDRFNNGIEAVIVARGV
jgi:hypothetical protein